MGFKTRRDSSATPQDLEGKSSPSLGAKRPPRPWRKFHERLNYTKCYCHFREDLPENPKWQQMLSNDVAAPCNQLMSLCDMSVALSQTLGVTVSDNDITSSLWSRPSSRRSKQTHHPTHVQETVRACHHPWCRLVWRGLQQCESNDICMASVLTFHVTILPWQAHNQNIAEG